MIYWKTVFSTKDFKLQVALGAVFPAEKIRSVTGSKNIDSWNKLDVESILGPISSFLPAELPEQVVDQSPAAEVNILTRLGEKNGRFE